MRICFRRRGLRPSRGPDSAISGVLPNIRLPPTLLHTAGARGDDSGDCAKLFRKWGWGWHRDEDEARGGVVRRWHGEQVKTVISAQKNHADHLLTLRDLKKNLSITVTMMTSTFPHPCWTSTELSTAFGYDLLAIRLNKFISHYPAFIPLPTIGYVKSFGCDWPNGSTKLRQLHLKPFTCLKTTTTASSLSYHSFFNLNILCSNLCDSLLHWYSPQLYITKTHKYYCAKTTWVRKIHSLSQLSDLQSQWSNEFGFKSVGHGKAYQVPTWMRRLLSLSSCKNCARTNTDITIDCKKEGCTLIHVMNGRLVYIECVWHMVT